METNDLKIFQKIARLNSISETAEQMGYTQSNITARLKVLENELDRPLFKRTNRGVELLKNGVILLNYTDAILDLIEKAKYEITNQPKELSLGATQVITKTYLTKSLISNGCNFTIYTREIKELTTMLEMSVLDGILINEKIDSPNMVCMNTFLESVNWFKSKESKTFLLDEKPIFVSRNKDCPYRKATYKFLANNNIFNCTLIEIDSLDTVMTLLENNMGYAILPIQLKNEKLEIDTSLPKLDDIKIYFYVHRKNESFMKNVYEKYVFSNKNEK